MGAVFTGCASFWSWPNLPYLKSQVSEKVTSMNAEGLGDFEQRAQ